MRLPQRAVVADRVLFNTPTSKETPSRATPTQEPIQSVFTQPRLFRTEEASPRGMNSSGCATIGGEENGPLERARANRLSMDDCPDGFHIDSNGSNDQVEEVAMQLSFPSDAEIYISFSQEIGALRGDDGSSDDSGNVCNEHIRTAKYGHHYKKLTQLSGMAKMLGMQW